MRIRNGQIHSILNKSAPNHRIGHSLEGLINHAMSDDLRSSNLSENIKHVGSGCDRPGDGMIIRVGPQPDHDPASRWRGTLIIGTRNMADTVKAAPDQKACNYQETKNPQKITTLSSFTQADRKRIDSVRPVRHSSNGFTPTLPFPWIRTDTDFASDSRFPITNIV